MSRSTKKSRKSVCANNGDRISELPVSIISHILSCLPSKDAVGTSILSKDWEYKWHCIYNIDIQDWKRYSRQRIKKTSFVSFVDSVLFLSRELRSFRLSCHEKYDSSRLTGWISAALRSNIEYFELEANDPKDLVLPRSLLNKTSLKTLKLTSSCTFLVPLNNYFPNLTHLYFVGVEIENMFSNTDPLVFTFPVLKTFKIKDCKWTNVNLVEIHSPALGKFKCETVVDAVANDYSIKICGARIDKFVSSGGFPENIIMYESEVLNAALKNHVKRDSDSNEEESDLQSGLQVRKLLKGFLSVKDLQLSYWMCQVISQAKQELPLPRYDMLQRLVIHVIDGELLVELLHSTPCLKFLEIKWFGEEAEYDEVEEFECDEVDPVPCCVVSHLEEVKFKSGEKSVIHLASFFLKYGVELKKVRLDGWYLRSHNAEIVEQLLKLPRASACLAIVSR